MALLLGILSLAFLGCLQVLRTLELRQVATLQRESLAANELLLRKWVDLTGQPLRRFVQDFARVEALSRFLSRPDPSWADANLRPNLAGLGAHAVWVLDAADRVLYHAQANPGPALTPPPRAGTAGNYFAESPAGLLELWSAPIASASPGAAGGTLLLARLWDEPHLASLGHLNESEVFLLPRELSDGPPAGREIRVPLPDAAGRPLRHLAARLPASVVPATLGSDLTTAYLFLGFALLVLLAVWLAVRRWVLAPLEQVGESLRRDDPAVIQPLLQDRTELGRVAQLVESSFRQKSALNREIAERRHTEDALRESEARLRNALDLRARLARDLHDGVIQSIYASGLGLEGAIAQMEKDPVGAKARLQLCRQSLNDVIREVRGFISGIEPEALHHQDFEQELGSLVRTMQALWPVLIRVHADPAVVAGLTPMQELHALQISRECISNAVRHGGAREIEVHLGAQGGTVFLRVRDKGRGFDLEAVRGKGRGLANLAARARELGGNLDIESRPGAGASIHVSFGLAPEKP